VPANEIDISPMSGELIVDKSGATNQVIVRLDAKNVSLREQLLRGTDARALDTQSGIERAFIELVRAAKDANLSSVLGEPSSARLVIPNGRDSDDVRHSSAENDPREILHQLIVLRYVNTSAATRALKILKQTSWFMHVQPDYALAPSSVATDPLYPIPSNPSNAGVYQWGLHAMNFAGAWSRTTGHAYVGVADAPIWPWAQSNLFNFGSTTSPSIANPDLRRNFRQQFAMLSAEMGTNVPSWDTVSPHGQHVTGIVAAGGSNTLGGTSNTGSVGGCPNCSIIFAGRRGAIAATSSFVDWLFKLGDAGASVVNLSANSGNLGLQCPAGDVSSVAIAAATNRDILVVISSGNDSSSVSAQYPANCTGVLSVGAAESVNSSVPTSWQRMNVNSLASPTNPVFASSSVIAGSAYGVIAPGRSILSTFNTTSVAYSNTPVGVNCGSGSGFDLSALGDLYGTCSGTSMAAPHVTALVGILRSAKPLETQSAIQSVIRSSTGLTTPSNIYIGWGMPNAGNALDALIPTSDPQSRLTPLFSMYSAGRQDYFYTTSPQMARAAFFGTVLPKGNDSSQTYNMVGTVVASYPSLPSTQWWQQTGAQA
jgi:serine protease